MGSAVHQIGSSVGGALGLGYAKDDPRSPTYGQPGNPGYVAPPPPPPPPPAPPAAPAPVATPPPPSLDNAAVADAAAKQRIARGRAMTMTSPMGLLGGLGPGFANQSTSTLLG